MKSIQERDEEINHVANVASASLKAGKDTLVMTSRQLITGRCQHYPFAFSLCFSFFFHELIVLIAVFYL